MVTIWTKVSGKMYKAINTITAAYDRFSALFSHKEEILLGRYFSKARQGRS